MMLAMRTNGWTGFALLMTAAAVVVWAVLAIYSAAGEHISSTAEDVAFVAALTAGVALIAAGLYALSNPSRPSAAVLLVSGVAVLVITYFFSPTTW
jgi:hypothetical protein